MRVTSAQAAAARTRHSGNSERTDPHKRSAQLDFFEKILGVCVRLREHAVAPRRQPRRRSRSVGEIKAAKTGSRMKQTRRDEGRRPRAPAKGRRDVEKRKRWKKNQEDVAAKKDKRIRGKSPSVAAELNEDSEAGKVLPRWRLGQLIFE